MSRAWHRGWKCVPGDVTTAFLQADLTGDAEVFIVPPETETGGRKILWKVSKAVYGLRGSPKNFNINFAKVASACGWKRTKCEPQLFYNHIAHFCGFFVHSWFFQTCLEMPDSVE